MKRMQEQLKRQHIPVKVYRTDERLMIAAPMAGLEPENIVVEVTADGRLILHGDLRAMLKEVRSFCWMNGALGSITASWRSQSRSMPRAPTSPTATAC